MLHLPVIRDGVLMFMFYLKIWSGFSGAEAEVIDACNLIETWTQSQILSRLFLEGISYGIRDLHPNLGKILTTPGKDRMLGANMLGKNVIVLEWCSGTVCFLIMARNIITLT